MEILEGMKTMSRKAPALLLAALLFSAALPVQSGGRDVPDAQDSSENEMNGSTPPEPEVCSDGPLIVTYSGIRFEVARDSRGGSYVRPALLGDLSRLTRWLFGSRSSSTSCPDR